VQGKGFEPSFTGKISTVSPVDILSIQGKGFELGFTGKKST